MKAFKPDLLTALAVVVTLGIITTMGLGDYNKRHILSNDKAKASKIHSKVYKSSHDRFKFVKAQQSKKNLVVPAKAAL